MATEPLIVEIDARTTRLEAALKKAGVALDDVDGKTTKADSKLKKFSGTATAAANGLATVTKATLAAAGALSAFIVVAAKSNQEMANMASTAKKTVEEFEPLAFAMSQFGVDTKGTADAMNDVTERLGEFAATAAATGQGSGAFQDFADVMKLGKEDAAALATELQFLSGDEALGRMVTQMEAANVPAAQMSFVLKSMSNDLEYASDAFKNNGAELDRLQKLYNKTAGQIKLTATESKQLQEAATNFDLMTSAMSKSGQYVSAQLAPLMDSFFGDVIRIIPEATDLLTDFINKFKPGEEQTSLESVNRQIQEQLATVGELRQELTELADANTKWYNDSDVIAGKVAKINASIAEETARIDVLIASRARLTEEEKAAVKERERLASLSVKAEGLDLGDSGATGTGDQIKEIEDRFKTETALLTEKLNQELKIVGENEQLKKELREQYQLDLEAIQQGKYAETYDQELAALAENYNASLELAINDNAAQLELHAQFLESKKALDLEYADAVIRSGQDIAAEAEANAKKRIKDDKAVTTQGVNNAATLATSALSLAAIAFEDNKGIQYAMTGINTAAGIMNQYASGDGLSAFARAAAVATTGVAQLAAIKSSTPGGTSVASVSSSAPTVAAQEEPESIDLDAQDVSGQSNSFVVRFEGGDDLTVALANNAKVMALDGTLDA